ncbi:thioredoxin family protein [Ideonella sp.]|uniref:thioredoxin family protein n=1 Tax=Ideonella sp. TaxID=1929293 RepID=UPI0035B3FC88
MTPPIALRLLPAVLVAAALCAGAPAAAQAPAAAASAAAAPLPYDERADAAAEVQRAQQTAARLGRPLLVVFGANWCGDCRALDKAMHTSANAAMLDKEFVVVKVDVGNFNRHLDIAGRYGNPIKKGIPAAAIVSPQGELLYATRGGELANARQMSDTGVYDFFHQAAARARAPR